MVVAGVAGCQGVYFKGHTEEKVVALTWDDGPDPVFTPEVLKILDGFQVKATFFLIGRAAQTYPEIVRQISARGHEIGNHSQNHLFYLSWLPRDRIRGEILEAQEAIYRITGTCPVYFRSPLGWVSEDLIAVCRDLRLPIINGSVKVGDVSQPGTDYIIEAVLDGVRNGAIIILHDAGGVGPFRDRSQTLEALPTIINKIKERGYHFVLLRELIGASQ